MIDYNQDFSRAFQAFSAASHGLLQPSKRQDAEKVIDKFGQTEESLLFAEYVLKTCNDTIVEFQASLLLQSSIINYWQGLQTTAQIALRSSIMNFVLTRVQEQRLDRAVLFQLLRDIAIMWKLSWLDKGQLESRQGLFQDIESFLSSENLSLVVLSLALLTSLVEEFSSKKASQLGATYEYHHRCIKSFERFGLKESFNYATQLLQNMQHWDQLEAQPIPLRVFELLRHLHGLIEAIRSWNFSHNQNSDGIIYDTMEEAPLFFRPGKNWRPIVGITLLDALFKIYSKSKRAILVQKCRDCEEAIHRVRQTISVFAELSGEIFVNEFEQKHYLAGFLQGIFLQLRAPLWPLDASLYTLKGFEGYFEDDIVRACAASEILDMCSILNKLVSNFGAKIFLSDQSEFNAIGEEFVRVAFKMASTLLEGISVFGKSYGESAVEDSWIMEAFNYILEALSGFANDIGYELYTDNPAGMNSVAKEYMKHVRSFFEMYVSCRMILAGFVDLSTEDATSAGEEYEDATTLELHMTMISSIARLDCASTFRILMNFLSSSHHHHNYNSSKRNEELFYFALLFGFISADPDDGEIPDVPPPIQKNTQLDGSSHENSFIQLTGSFLKVLQSEAHRVKDNPNNENLSPLVAEKFLWAFSRWANTYLPRDEYFERAYKNSHLLAFSNKEIIGVVAEICNLYLSCWGFQHKVILEVLELLKVVIARAPVIQTLKSTTSWNKLVNAHIQSCKHQDDNWDPLSSLFPEDHAFLVENICRAYSPSRIAPIEHKEENFRQLTLIISPLRDRLESIVLRSQVNTDYNITPTILRITFLYQGMVGATTSDSVAAWVQEVVTSALSGPFTELSSAFVQSTYNPRVVSDAERQLIVSRILQLVLTLLRNHLTIATETNASSMIQCAMNLIGIYTKSHRETSVSSSLAKNAIASEEQQSVVNDIVCLLEILSCISERDLVDFSDTDKSESNIDATTIVLQGLNPVIPWLTKDVFDYPKVAEEYFSLLTGLIKLKPEKLMNVQTGMLNAVFQSLKYGIHDYRSDVVRATFDALYSLAQWLAMQKHGTMHTQDPSMQITFHTQFLKLLKDIFDLLIYSKYDSGVLDSASNAVLALVACEEDGFKSIIEAIIQSQEDIDVKQRLRNCFNALFTNNNVKVAFDRQNRRNFNKNFHAFIRSVRAFMRRR